ncbi:tRNA (adenosine(37)-N6)-dimethylallyltransferase MiaA [Collinsella sp. zg1085]|uniref:tRNA (adenosine(37)-N6)-dimethylallyltransferase MiaA n=1 Tax=Collinsella sp. zg1085 TaxID=2844380 RepID=UPI001C0DB337|nr:tRNA (adenosine(37)-N6)-dimethylallyltransferase MiaA [Collinsella sp. zg1085]QWT17000.1 tRNA (adenosine(37)-N6)-dimethylallyltransferase MiaA [Collinsella sp. zg1085]
MSQLPVIALCGPTAVGKSALADRVAAHMGSSVISADAMQIYRGMDIGTAKTPIETRLVPLEMVDIVSPGTAYSAALFQRDARVCIERALTEKRVPILCGGTGLYLRAALDVMQFAHGELESATRLRLQAEAQELGAHALHERLAALDPASAALIHEHNVVRTIRALELYEQGLSYAQQSQGFQQPQSYYPTLWFALTCNREKLYARIDARVDAMIEQGLVDEVDVLIGDGYAHALTAQQAIGYKELIAWREGQSKLHEAIALIKQRSRRYAKRQLSWCRSDKRFIWLDMDTLTLDEACSLILRHWQAAHEAN